LHHDEEFWVRVDARLDPTWYLTTTYYRKEGPWRGPTQIRTRFQWDLIRIEEVPEEEFLCTILAR
jgi:hypothetical protein